MRRLYVLLASAVIATTLIAVAGQVRAAGMGPHQPGAAPATGAEYFALAIAPSLLKVPNQPPNMFDPEAGEGLGTNLTQAKKQALTNCENNGVTNQQYYKDDCQGAVWVHNGWLALATEQLAKTAKPPYRYKYAYGGAYGKTRNQAIGKAIDNCYLKDPQYEQCVFVDSGSTSDLNPNTATQGGAW